MINVIKDEDIYWHFREYDIILIGTNIYCTMSQGIQLKVMLNYPYVYEKNLETKYGDIDKMGTILECKSENEPTFCLCFIAKGYNFRPDLEKDYLSYDALENALKLVNIKYKGKKIACPLLGSSRFDGNGDKEKINSNNFASNNSSKSGSSSNKTNSDSCKISSSNNSNNSNALGSSQNLSLKSKNSKNFGNPQRKKYFNKFNSAKENNTNSENTVILTLKIKVAKDDYRVFNLKKYDDLFISLEKFFDLNKIEQSLVKPIVTKIFTALNKIFWLLNNKIGIYDQEYLNSLYKLWMKNNEKIPKRNQENKNKSKEDSNNSTISSSDSTDENKKHKRLLSNSFQNMDNLSEDEKQNTVKSI